MDYLSEGRKQKAEMDYARPRFGKQKAESRRQKKTTQGHASGRLSFCFLPSAF
jgi:hypothetical protein